MKPLTKEFLGYLIQDRIKLCEYLSDIKQKADDLDLCEFRRFVESKKEQLCDIDIWDYYESFVGLEFYDNKYISENFILKTWNEWKPIFKALGILGNGNNKLFNKLLNHIRSLMQKEKNEYQKYKLDEYNSFLMTVNLIRIEIGRVMVNIGLLG